MFPLKRNSTLFLSVCSMSLLLACLLRQPSTADACSSRSIVKPRTLTSSSPTTTISTPTTIAPTTTTTTTERPNITFPTYKCPETYDAWYCLNEATCFSIKLGESVMFNCECASGFMGPRCEYKEIDASFLPKRPRPMLEEASIASGAICALLFVVVICLTLYMRYEQRSNIKGLALDGGEEYDVDDDEHHANANDEYGGGECTYFTTKACSFCNEKNCCGAEIRVKDIRGIGLGGKHARYDGYSATFSEGGNASGGGGGVTPSLRHYIDMISTSFTIRRSTKM